MRFFAGRFVHRAVTAVAVMLLLMATTGQVASAAEFREGDIITIGADQVIDDDLYVFGNSVIIDGTVSGDVVAVGQQITIHGSVGGSVNAVGQTVNVTGQVGRAVRVTGGKVQVSGEIGGDLVSLGADIELTDSGIVRGDVVMSASSASLDGSIGRNVKGGLSELSIAGPVGGDVDVQVDRLAVKNTAAIDGSLVYTSAADAEIEDGSQVGGATTRKVPVSQPNWWIRLLLLVWTFVLGAALILLAPSAAETVARTVTDRPFGSLGFGALAIFLTPFVMLILGLTIVGLPLAALLLVGYFIAIFLSQVFVGLALGKWIMRNVLPGTSRGALVAALAVGLIVLTVFTSLPIPVLGGLVSLTIIFLGLGALVISIAHLPLRTRQSTVR